MHTLNKAGVTSFHEPKIDARSNRQNEVSSTSLRSLTGRRSKTSFLFRLEQATFKGEHGTSERALNYGTLLYSSSQFQVFERVKWEAQERHGRREAKTGRICSIPSIFARPTLSSDRHRTQLEHFQRGALCPSDLRIER